MKTAYCPRKHIKLASKSICEPYGHVPGHNYHDIDVVISTGMDYGSLIRVHVCETWGSAQGCDEEHGRREAIAHGQSIGDACQEARERSIRSGIETERLEQAISLAEDEATEREAADVQ